MKNFESQFKAAKRASTLQLLFKCSRLLNEQAIATAPHRSAVRRLGPSHLGLLAHIALDHGTRVTELATKAQVSKQAVGQLVDDLEAEGVVERRPDPADGRAKRVVFTPQGRRAMMDGLDHLQTVERQLADKVGKSTVASLRRALLVIVDCLEAESSL